MAKTRDEYYKVLGVEPGISGKDLKRRYRTLALKYHPDRNPGDPEAEEIFKQVDDAYKALTQPQEEPSAVAEVIRPGFSDIFKNLAASMRNNRSKPEPIKPIPYPPQPSPKEQPKDFVYFSTGVNRLFELADGPLNSGSLSDIVPTMGLNEGKIIEEEFKPYPNARYALIGAFYLLDTSGKSSHSEALLSLASLAVMFQKEVIAAATAYCRSLLSGQVQPAEVNIITEAFKGSLRYFSGKTDMPAAVEDLEMIVEPAQQLISAINFKGEVMGSIALAKRRAQIVGYALSFDDLSFSARLLASINDCIASDKRFFVNLGSYLPALNEIFSPVISEHGESTLIQYLSIISAIQKTRLRASLKPGLFTQFLRDMVSGPSPALPKDYIQDATGFIKAVAAGANTFDNAQDTRAPIKGWLDCLRTYLPEYSANPAAYQAATHALAALQAKRPREHNYPPVFRIAAQAACLFASRLCEEQYRASRAAEIFSKFRDTEFYKSSKQPAEKYIPSDDSEISIYKILSARQRNSLDKDSIDGIVTLL